MAANNLSPKQSRKNTIRVLAFIGAIFGLLALVQIGNLYSWTGFGTKTLWDWLELLIVPMVLAGGALLFNWTNTREERNTAKQREKIDRDIATDNSQEVLLQSYLDRMTDLLLKNKLRTTDDLEVRAVATARTVTVLHRLDSRRRTNLLTFLRQAKLIGGDSIGVLRGADLSEADLSDTTLNDADLRHAYMFRTNLSDSVFYKALLANANMYEANFTGAYLIETDLTNAFLRRAILTGADLSGCNLMNAALKDANLSNTNLKGADLRSADLSGANLHGSNLDKTILAKAIYDKHTKWPDGFKPPPNAVKVEN